MSHIDEVLDLVEKYQDKWRDKSDLFWYFSLLEEIIELLLALLGLHQHSPDFELKQIASIAINWLEKRENA